MVETKPHLPFDAHNLFQNDITSYVEAPGLAGRQVTVLTLWMLLRSHTLHPLGSI